jgi:hypothetical protein
MKKLLGSLGAFVSCLFVAHHYQPTTIEKVAAIGPTPTPIVQNIKPSNLTPKITLGTVDSNPEEKPMIVEAVEYVNDVIASDCFKKEVLNAKFTETNGLTNDQIFATFQGAIPPIAVTMFDGTWKQNYVYKTIGYEDEGFPNTVFQNRYFVDNAKDSGSNILHEVAHVLGFHHYDVFATSVPYQMNDFYYSCFDVLGIKEE